MFRVSLVGINRKTFFARALVDTVCFIGCYVKNFSGKILTLEDRREGDFNQETQGIGDMIRRN